MNRFNTTNTMESLSKQNIEAALKRLNVVKNEVENNVVDKNNVVDITTLEILDSAINFIEHNEKSRKDWFKRDRFNDAYEDLIAFAMLPTPIALIRSLADFIVNANSDIIKAYIDDWELKGQFASLEDAAVDMVLREGYSRLTENHHNYHGDISNNLRNYISQWMDLYLRYSLEKRAGAPDYFFNDIVQKNILGRNWRRASRGETYDASWLSHLFNDSNTGSNAAVVDAFVEIDSERTSNGLGMAMWQNRWRPEATFRRLDPANEKYHIYDVAIKNFGNSQRRIAYRKTALSDMDTMVRHILWGACEAIKSIAINSNTRPAVTNSGNNKQYQNTRVMW